MAHPLPAAFADLQSFADRYALDTERERHAERLKGPFEDLKALYDAVLPRLDAIHAHLKQYPWPDLPSAEQSLLNLALALMEVSLAVESHGQPTVPFGFDHTRFRVHF
ncbi:hypothetical protein [Immundisolibacter sp.]|uniref:hypothetical protein n=1 Tax=Immundisolibacter sp. TaxID=1934948 RepID=UPI002B168BD5|nr:hypothetical protein [Immundisolibacter sp.]MEA3219131.1 hypothetical protein [Immundisolibacter sp.]